MAKSADDASIAVVTAAVLRRGRMLHFISLIFSGLVLAWFLYKGAVFSAMPVLVLLFGLAEFWFALRVALDADLFAAIGEGKLDAVKLDDALQRLGFIKKAKAGRSMEERSRGALRLLKLQGLCLLLQVATYFAQV
jgi:hypothetical protein